MKGSICVLCVSLRTWAPKSSGSDFNHPTPHHEASHNVYTGPNTDTRRTLHSGTGLWIQTLAPYTQPGAAMPQSSDTAPWSWPWHLHTPCQRPEPGTLQTRLQSEPPPAPNRSRCDQLMSGGSGWCGAEHQDWACTEVIL